MWDFIIFEFGNKHWKVSKQTLYTTQRGFGILSFLNSGTKVGKKVNNASSPYQTKGIGDFVISKLGNRTWKVGRQHPSPELPPELFLCFVTDFQHTERPKSIIEWSPSG